MVFFLFSYIFKNDFLLKSKKYTLCVLRVLSFSPFDVDWHKVRENKQTCLYAVYSLNTNIFLAIFFGVGSTSWMECWIIILGRGPNRHVLVCGENIKTKSRKIDFWTFRGEEKRSFIWTVMRLVNERSTKVCVSFLKNSSALVRFFRENSSLLVWIKFSILLNEFECNFLI